MVLIHIYVMRFSSSLSFKSATEWKPYHTQYYPPVHYNSNPLEMTAIQTRMSIIIVDIIENEKKTSAPHEFGSKSSSSSSTSFGTKKLYSC